MTTLFAPALRTACRSEAMSATLSALPAAALPVTLSAAKIGARVWSCT
jgi:hypothetical protein